MPGAIKPGTPSIDEAEEDVAVVGVFEPPELVESWRIEEEEDDVVELLIMPGAGEEDRGVLGDWIGDAERVDLVRLGEDARGVSDRAERGFGLETRGEDTGLSTEDPLGGKGLPWLLLFVSDRVAILTPSASSLIAGMKSVVGPPFRLTAMRLGWFAAQQPSSSDSIAVLYSCKASASL